MRVAAYLSQVWALLLARGLVRHLSSLLAGIPNAQSSQRLDSQRSTSVDIESAAATVSRISGLGIDSSDLFSDEELALGQVLVNVGSISFRSVTPDATQELPPTHVSEIASGQRLLLRYLAGESSEGHRLRWDECLNCDGIVVQTSNVQGSEWKAIKASALFSASAKSILEVLLDDSKVSAYDELFESSNEILRVSERARVQHMFYKRVWPAAPRDFSVITAWEELSDGSILVISKSVGEANPTPPYVRGNIIVGGYRLKQLRGKQCEVTLLSHTELGGSVPASLVNSYIASAPFKMLAALRKLAENSQ